MNTLQFKQMMKLEVKCLRICVICLLQENFLQALMAPARILFTGKHWNKLLLALANDLRLLLFLPKEI